jgi:hypothetical protein
LTSASPAIGGERSYRFSTSALRAADKAAVHQLGRQGNGGDGPQDNGSAQCM